MKKYDDGLCPIQEYNQFKVDDLLLFDTIVTDGEIDVEAILDLVKLTLLRQIIDSISRSGD